MLKFAKIIDEKTKTCLVGTGTNENLYKKMGMSKMEVEKGYNGVWYLEGYAPKEPESGESTDNETLANSNNSNN